MTNSSHQPVTVHMVGNAHIDPVWLWPLSEGRAEVLSTYRTAISLIDQYPGYLFSSGGAATYEWVRQDDPALFARIQRAVDDGQWVLVNGWWLQPDCNVPSGESFARHGLYGQRYLLDHFGRRAQVGYNVDSFGHAGTLPQILVQSGLDAYVFFRPDPGEKALPDTPFWWQSPDGSRVLTHRPPLHYCSPEDDDVVARAEQVADQTPSDMPVAICFYGVGNHGGGPTRANVEQLVAAMQRDGAVRPIFSSPDAYFEAVAALDRDWPVVADELQHHSRGCYTALSRVKRENRQCEHALLAAERWDTLASLLREQPPQGAALREAWTQVLFNQFHDILAGTSLESAYEDVWTGYRQAREIAQETQARAIEALESLIAIPQRENASPLLVWNPSPWTRKEVVRLAVPMGGWHDDWSGEHYPDTPVVRDARGDFLPSQLREVVFDQSTYVVHIDTLVEAPALGPKVLQVEIPTTSHPESDPVAPVAHEIENEALRLVVDPRTGWIESLYDRLAGRECLAGEGAVPLVMDDPSDTWSHDVVAFRRTIGRFRAVGPVRLVAAGPLTQTLRVESAWGASRLVCDYSLRSNERALHIDLHVDWHQKLKMLKLAFPYALEDAQVTTDAPYGHIERPADGEEHPCQAWVDLTSGSSKQPWGVCLLNDSKYGYDALEGELRMSLLRSPIYAFHRPRQVQPGVSYRYTDQGVQKVRLVLLPHDGDWRSVHPDRRADALQEPLIARLAQPQEGIDADGGVGLQVDVEHATLTVVKRAEDGQALVVRGFETDGIERTVTLHSEVLGYAWQVALRPYQVFTVALPLDGGEAKTLNILEQ